MKLQLAFDFLELPDITRIVRKLEDVIDIVEIGTPVIIREGIRAVRRMKRSFPSLEVLADLKIMDGGEYESSLAFAAGADIVTVLALADDATVAQAVKAAEAYQRKIMVDMIGVRELGLRAREIEGLGASYVCVHTAIDVQHTGKNPQQDLSEIKRVLRKAGTAVAGGIGLETIHGVLKQNPDIVIVGAGITRQADPRAAAQEMKRIMQK